MSYFNAVSQLVTSDPNNSYSTNLNSNESFTGSASSTLNVAGIQLSLKTDQRCTVFVDQSPDGTNWDITDSYSYYTIAPFGITVQAIGAYYRVRVTNVDTTTTTFFRLKTVLCPIVDSIPRSLSSEGNLKVGVYEIEGDFGTKVTVTPMNALRTTESLLLVGSPFIGTTLDTNFWTSTIANGGSFSQTGGALTLLTNTTANGTSKIQSVRYARYISGHTNSYRSNVRCPAKVGTTNTRRWGAYDANDGYFFLYDGTTFSVGYRKATVDTTVASGNFVGNQGSTYVVDLFVHTYEIYWTTKVVYFFVDSELLHTITAPSTTLVSTPTLAITSECNNSGGNTSANTLEIRSSTIHRLGSLQTQNISKYQSGTTAGVICKYGAGNLQEAIISNVTDNSVVTIYDNTAASGTILWSSGAINTGASTESITAVDFKNIPFATGLTFAITTANCNLLLIYA